MSTLALVLTTTHNSIDLLASFSFAGLASTMSCRARFARNFSLLICFGLKRKTFGKNHHLDVKRLRYVWDSKVNQLADAEDKMLEDDHKEKPQGKNKPVWWEIGNSIWQLSWLLIICYIMIYEYWWLLMIIDDMEKVLYVTSGQESDFPHGRGILWNKKRKIIFYHLCPHKKKIKKSLSPQPVKAVR